MYLPEETSRARQREAEHARGNRLEILRAWSQGQISRRDLIKLGLFTAGGSIILKHGLSPLAPSALADSTIPTGLPRSPLFGAQPFSQPMHRVDLLARQPMSALNPAPLPDGTANTAQQTLNSALEGVKPGDAGPIESFMPPSANWRAQLVQCLSFCRWLPGHWWSMTRQASPIASLESSCTRISNPKWSSRAIPVFWVMRAPTIRQSNA